MGAQFHVSSVNGTLTHPMEGEKAFLFLRFRYRKETREGAKTGGGGEDDKRMETTEGGENGRHLPTFELTAGALAGFGFL